MNPSRPFVVNAPTTCFTNPSAAAISIAARLLEDDTVFHDEAHFPSAPTFLVGSPSSTTRSAS
jgi:hypothetical protein